MASKAVTVKTTRSLTARVYGAISNAVTEVSEMGIVNLKWRSEMEIQGRQRNGEEIGSRTQMTLSLSDRVEVQLEVTAVYELSTVLQCTGENWYSVLYRSFDTHQQTENLYGIIQRIERETSRLSQACSAQAGGDAALDVPVVIDWCVTS